MSVLPQVAENVLLCPPGDIEAVRQLLAQHEDVAAVILEPTGASWGQIPIAVSFLHELRDVTADHDVVLIFDEVITGFRCSPGGAQEYYGIIPDLTTLAKILAGGFSGGALVGRKDIMDWLDHDASAQQGREKVAHQGTYNANPVSAAAGTQALQIVAETDACQRANDYAAKLREALRRMLRDENVNWRVYGTFSGFHIFTNPDHEAVTEDEISNAQFDYRKLAAAGRSELPPKLRVGMLAYGVDIVAWPGGPTSAVHDSDDLERTVESMRRTVRILREEGDI